ARKQEIEDNVIPSSNSVMAMVLYKLGLYFDKVEYIERAKKMVAGISDQIPKAAPYFANWIQLIGMMAEGAFEVAIVGEKAMQKNRAMQQEFLPVSIYLGGQQENLPLLEKKRTEGKTVIYVCRNKVCK